MNTKTTWVLLLLVLLLGGYIAFVEKHLGSSIERRTRARLAFRISPEEVTYLRMERNTMRMECVKQGKDWFLRYPEGIRAQSALISKILSRLSRLEKGEIITEKDMRDRQLNLSHYGLDRPELRISLGNEFAQRTLLVGRTAPLGDGLYVKDQAHPDVLSVTVDLLDIIPASLDELRDRHVLPMQGNTLSKIEIQRAEGFLRLERTAQGRWDITQPAPGAGDQAAIGEWLTQLASVRIEKYITDAPTNDSQYGFGENADFVKWWTVDQKDPLKLLLGGDVADETGLVYARMEHVNSVFALPAGFHQLIKLDVNVLRDRTLLPFAVEKVVSMVIRKKDRELVFNRADGHWQLAEPKAWKVEPALMEALLTAWAQAQVSRFLDPGDPGTLVNTNELLVSVAFTRQAETAEAVPAAAAGHSTPDAVFSFYTFADGSGRLMVFMASMDIWAEAPQGLLRLISLEALDYRDREVMQLEGTDVIRISRQAGEDTVNISRKGPGDLWKPVEAGCQVEPARVAMLLDACRRLRARKFIARDPADLGQYGLDSPRVRLSFGLTGKTGIGKTLLLGQDVEGGGIYAMVLGQDLVFLLDAQTRDILLQACCTPLEPAAEKDRERPSPSPPAP